MGPLKNFLIQQKEILLIAFLVIFYSVGTIGILTPSVKAQFLELSFLNLILSMLVVVLARNSKMKVFILFLLLCFCVGMLAELIGTKTGLLFGEYCYGDNLGPKFFGVPYVIGFNWGILIVCSASLVNRFSLPLIIKVIFAATLMTGLDYLLEPVAIKSDYWSWEGEIPLYNYICWFVVSLPLHYLYFQTKLVESNKVYNILFLILCTFFIILNSF